MAVFAPKMVKTETSRYICNFTESFDCKERHQLQSEFNSNAILPNAAKVCENLLWQVSSRGKFDFNKCLQKFSL